MSTTTQSLFTRLRPSRAIAMTVALLVGLSLLAPGAATPAFAATGSVTSVAPDQGTTAGGTPVEITGTGFGESGTPAVTIGGTAATSVVRESDTLLTALTPAGAAGSAVIVVTPEGGEPITATGVFEYRSSFAAPTITTVAPSEGSAPGGELVTIGGSGLDAVTVVRFGAVEIDWRYFVDRGANGSSITVRAPARAPGAVSMAVVTSTQVVQRDAAYTYLTPTVTAMSPTSGPETGGTRVTITGAGFGISGTPSVSIGGRSATAITRVSSTSIQATTPSGTVGSAPVVVTVTAASPAIVATGSTSFTYAAVSTAPTITAVTPNRGPLAGGENVTISGTNLSIGTTVRFGDVAGTVQAAATAGTSLIVQVPAGVEPGAVSVRVANSAGAATMPRAYTYAAVPTISAVSPSTIITDGGNLITVTGSGFGASGTPSVSVGGRPATCVVRVSDTQLTAVTPSGFNGPASVSVSPDTRGGTATATGAVTYQAATTTPTIASISPASGTSIGGTTVTITGTGFGDGTPVVRFGDVCAAAVISHSGTSIEVVTPAGAVGGSTVSVTMATGRAAAVDGFSYVAPPLFSAVSPNWGYSAGGGAVTIVGRGFGVGTPTVTFAGVPAVVTSSTDEFIYVNVPAGVVGPVNVVVTPQGGSPLPKVNAFTYRAALVQSVLPEAGPESGGTTITITGEGFGSGTPQVTIGGVPATGIQLQSATRISVVTPAGTGAADIRITPAQGTGTGVLVGGYRYVPEIRTPIITSSLPVRAPQEGGTLVSVLGEHFLGSDGVPARVVLERNGVVSQVSSLAVADQGQLTFRSPALNPGVYQLRLTTNEGYALLNYALTVPHPPVIDSCDAVSPRGIYVDANPGPVRVTGSGFGDGTPSVTVAGVLATVLESSDTSVLFTAPVPVRLGAQAIVVYPSTGAGAFTIDSCLTAYASMWIDPDDKTINYGEPTPTFTATTDGLWGSDAVSAVEYRFNGGSTVPTRAGTYTISVNQVTLNPGSISNYNLERRVGTYTIIGLAANVYASVPDHEYGSPLIPTVTATGLENGDTLLSADLVYTGTTRAGDAYGPTFAEPTDAGEYFVRPANADVGENTGNYDLRYSGDWFEITPRPLTVTVDDVQKVYGSPDPVFTYAITTGALVEGDVLQDLLVRDAGEDVRPGNLGYRITGDADAGPNYNLSFIDGRLFITPKPISVTVVDASKYYGDDDPTLSAIAQGLIEGDELDLEISRDPGEDIGFYDIVADGVSPTLNYEIITTESGQLRIDPRPITVDVKPLTLTYGDVETGWAPVLRSGSLAFTDTLGTVQVQLVDPTETPRPAGEHLVTATAVQIVGSNAANYVITYGTGTLTIERKPVTVTVGTAEIAYLDPTANLTVSAVGLLAQHSITSSTLLYTSESLGSSTTQPTMVGTFTVSIDSVEFGSATANYDITSEDGTLLITKRALQIAVANATTVYGTSEPAPVITLVNDSEGVLLSTEDAAAVAAAVTREAGLRAGDYDYELDADAESNFVIELVGSSALTITPKPITVTAKPATKIYGDLAPALEAESAELVGDDVLVGDLGRETGENVGTLAITQGTVDSARNPDYLITFLDGTFTITARAITVTVTDESITYGEDLPVWRIALSAGSLGFEDELGGATVAVEPSTAVPARAGSYSLTPSELTLSTGDTGNYSVAYDSGSLTVAPRALVVTADNQSIYFGGTVVAVTAATTGLQPNDAESLTFTAQFRGIEGTVYGPSATVPTGAGTYAIELTEIEVGASTDDYDITAVAGELVIAPGAISITVESTTKVYGTPEDPAFVVTSTEPALSETEVDTIEAALVRAPGEDVGSYAISLDENVALNYDVTISSDSAAPVLQITPKSIDVVIGNASKQFGDADPVFTSAATGLVGDDVLLGVPARTDESENLGTYAIGRGTLDGGSNYTIGTVTPGTLTIEQRAVVVGVVDRSITYGEADGGFVGVLLEGSTLVGDDELGSVTTDLVDAGGLRPVGQVTVNAASVAITNGDLANYSVEYRAGTLTVVPLAVTVTIEDASIVYGAADPTFTVDDSALLGTDALSGAASRASGTGVGEYEIARGTLDAGENYALTVEPGTLTITQRPLGVVIADATKVYGADDPALTWTLESGTVVDGDDLSGLLEREAGEDVRDGGYAITADEAAFPNYAFTVDAGVLDITPKPIDVIIDSASKQFGDADPAFTYSVVDVASGATLTGALERAAGDTPGTYAISRGTLDGGANYTIGTVAPGTLTIEQRAVVVGVVDRSITYGDADGGFVGVLLEGSTLVGDDELGSVTTDLVDAGGLRPVGSVTVNALSVAITNGDLANYSVEYRAGTLTVVPLAVTVTIEDASIVYGAADPLFTVDDSALLGDDVLTGAPSRASGTDVGEYGIERGDLSAGDNYVLTVEPGTLTITQRPITITLDDAAKIYGQADPAFSFTAPDGVDLSDGDRAAITGLITREAGDDAGEYTLSVPSTSNGNFAVTAVTDAGVLTISRKPITVSAQPATKVYGTADPELVPLSDGLVGDDELAGALGRAAGSDVGTYAIEQGTVDSDRNPNYTVTWSAGAELTIEQRTIELSVVDATKVYGGAEPTYSFTITDGTLVDGDAVTGSPLRDAGEDVGGIAIRAGSLAISDNYAVRVIEGTLTITARPIAIEIDDAAKEFGDDDPTAFVWRIGEGTLVADDAITGAPSRVTGENVGEYGITLGTLTAGGNYTLTSDGGEFAITPRAVTVTVDDVAKVFGEADPEFTFTITQGSLLDEADADVVGGELGRSNDAESVGEYTVTALPSAGANYLVTAVAGTLTITPRPVVVTPVATGKVYGDGDPTLAFTVDDAVAGTPVAGELARGAGDSAGEYPITAGSVTTAANANYIVTVTQGIVFTIAQRAVEVTVGGSGKVYGDDDPESLGIDITGGRLIGTDSLVGAPSRDAGEDVGAYSVTQGGLSLSDDYALTVVPGTFSVTPRTLELGLGVTISAYGETIAPAVPSRSGLQFDDEIVAMVETFDGSTAAATEPGSTERSIESVVTAPGAASNYTLAVSSGTHVITGPNAVRIDPAEGLTTGGLPFEITGSGFGSATPSVLFDGLPATDVVLHGHDRISGTTPAHEVGAVTVTVVTAAGETDLTNAYTYGAPIPGPVVLSMSPGFGPVDGGTEITITGAHLVGSDNVPAEVFLAGVRVADVRVAEDGSSLVAVTPPGAEGARDLDVLTSDGGVTFFGGFTYVAGQVGDIEGSLWLDLNSDGVRDAGEPPLPDVLIELIPEEGDIARMSLAAAAPSAPAAVSAASARTTATGAYSFTGMPYGSYSLRVTLPDGLRMTAGPGIGGVSSSVVLGAASLRLDVAFAGDQSATFTVTTADGATVPGAAITLRWAGSDGFCGTGDDVVIETVTDGAGAVALGNLPAGRWCVSVDAAGWQVSSAAFDLSGSGAGRLSIVLGSRLAYTGVEAGSLVALASILLLGGAVTILTNRRRRAMAGAR